MSEPKPKHNEVTPMFAIGLFISVPFIVYLMYMMMNDGAQ